jgi:hypothetical protein
MNLIEAIELRLHAVTRWLAFKVDSTHVRARASSVLRVRPHAILHSVMSRHPLELER